jgi:hypothetical protein
VVRSYQLAFKPLKSEAEGQACGILVAQRHERLAMLGPVRIDDCQRGCGVLRLVVKLVVKRVVKRAIALVRGHSRQIITP